LQNRVTDYFGSVGGGYYNRAGDDAGTAFNLCCATVAGSMNNAAGGAYATVPGGDLNSAAGTYSFAAGHEAKANHDGAFV
jgi:hypothetical protein